MPKKISEEQREAFRKGRNKDVTAANAMRVSNADEFAEKIIQIINDYSRRGGLTATTIADQLSANQVSKRRGGTNWTATDVQRIKRRCLRLQKENPNQKADS